MVAQEISADDAAVGIDVGNYKVSQANKSVEVQLKAAFAIKADGTLTANRGGPVLLDSLLAGLTGIKLTLAPKSKRK